MRLIDADAITYSWTVDADGYQHDGVTLQSIIDRLPTIANPIIVKEVPAEVVCCKDCKLGFEHGHNHNLPIRWCAKWRNVMRECDFCSYAERCDT